MNYFDILFAKYKYEKDHPPIIKRTTGNPIVLTDAADAPLVECVTEIQGSQDLHGQDKPWVGGAGKNKANIAENTTLPMSTSNYRIYHQEEDTVLGQMVIISFFFENAVYSSNAGALVNIQSKDGTPHYYTPPQFGMTPNTPLNGIYTLVSQSTVNFNDVFVYLGNSYAQFSSGKVSVMLQIGSDETTPTSFIPYENICPITAYTEGEIEVRGKNMLDDTNWQAGRIRITDGQITDTSSDFKHYVLSVFYGQVITLNWRYYSTSNYGMGFYDKNGNFMSGQIQGYSDASKNYFTFTVPEGCRIVKVSINSGDTSLTGRQAELGSTATTYEPYTSTTHTATFSQSIYQGNADFVGGKARATWGYIASYNGETLPGEWISSMDEYAPGTTPTTGAQVAYELASPTEETITPTNLPIKSLFGYNHIESSTGDLDITYLTQDYQNFVDIIENNFENNLRTRKGGIKPLDVFRTLEVNKEPEEEEKKDEKVEDVKK